jgi:hypothetical protein
MAAGLMVGVAEHAHLTAGQGPGVNIGRAGLWRGPPVATGTTIEERANAVAEADKQGSETTTIGTTTTTG